MNDGTPARWLILRIVLTGVLPFVAVDQSSSKLTDNIPDDDFRNYMSREILEISPRY